METWQHFHLFRVSRVFRSYGRFTILLLIIGALVCFDNSAFSYSKQPSNKDKAAASNSSLATSNIVELKLLPESLVLENKRDIRRVVVLGRTRDGAWVDLSPQATFKPDSDSVQVDKEGYFSPVKVGKSRVAVGVSGKQAYLPIEVRSVDSTPVSFVREVMPILSKTGCNAGTCHGSAKGKNGFKLSLRGYDPKFDYNALIEDISGRRFNRAAPEQSLILLKPIQGVPHQGGFVFESNSLYYNILHQWISEGVRFDGNTTARVERLEMLPQSPEMSLPGMSQQMIVIAHYPDGTTRDVTKDAVYTSSVPEVATVTPDGLVTAVRRGEMAVLVRYEGAYATNNVVVMGDRTGFKWTEVPETNYIDTLVYKKLKRLKILPTELCSDPDFIRRAYIDIAGLTPTPEQVRAFLNDPTPSQSKREKLVDQLLESPEYIEHWANKWADLLQVNRKYLGEKGAWLYRMWIKEAIASNKPYDQFVRELITTSGSTYDNRAANFFRVASDPPIFPQTASALDPTKATESVTQLFLGVRFACAKCHDHPFERWTQNQYYQFGAYFAKVGIKKGERGEQERIGEATINGEEIIYEKNDNKEVIHPKYGYPVAPSVPFGSADAVSNGSSRREALTKWLTSKDNPLFAKSMANRIWSYFLGRGIIDPVDDIRSSNPPSNAELLDALTEDFIKSGFDIKHLIRTIARSRVYQHSIVANSWNEDDTINFSHSIPRRLTAEQLLDAISVATGSKQKFPSLPLGARACELPDGSVEVSFLKMFGRPPRESPCECERTTNLISLGQALNLINGPTISDAIIDPNGRVVQIIKENYDDRKLVEEIFLAALSRMPREDEVTKAVEHIKSSESRTEAAQDLLWALLNSPAFLFNR
jgi:hypothetical protein